MATVVTRNIPQIVLIDREELGTIDRIVLSTLYKTGIDEFVRDRERYRERNIYKER